MKTTDCGKRIRISCKREPKDTHRIYNIPISFLNQFDIDEEKKKKAIEILSAMPQNFTITKCSSDSTSPECSTNATSESPGESTANSAGESDEESDEKSGKDSGNESGIESGIESGKESGKEESSESSWDYEDDEVDKRQRKEKYWKVCIKK